MFITKQEDYNDSYFSILYTTNNKAKQFVITLYYLWIAATCLLFPIRAGKKSRILDVGAGIGNLIRALRTYGVEAYGIEPSRAAKKYSLASDYIQYKSVKKLPFPQNYFDLVYTNEVLEHIKKDELPHILSEMKRVAKGVQIHMVGVQERGRVVIEEPTHVTIWTEKQWERFFISQGYTVQKGSPWYFFPNIHEIVTGRLSLFGFRKGYFILSR